MKRLSSALLTILVIGVFAGFTPTRGGAVAASVDSVGGGSLRPSSSDLSRYWSPRVQQWESLIVQEAERRQLDSDLLASLVWMESRGDAVAVGPVGAVGLMQVMPREAGFAWRPTHDELLDPETNLFWGTRTLATVVKQGEGDIFNALAAYNGGWAQIMYRGPKRFATTILQDYAHAVAARHGLDDDGWVAFFAVDQGLIAGPIWVADADRGDVY
ncbi:MAG: transglycosylase SLT domain-containing protein, partial [Anaerolineae bacterium]|nr:transglycosylase SLT domain-containing protein [Anaerolineae bacterium]